MFKQVWFQTHWIIGITAGVVLAVVGVTGGLLSFETQILDWLNSDVRIVSSRPESPLAPAELVKRIAAANPKRQITALSVSSDPSAAAKVTFARPRTAGKDPSGRPGRGARGEARYIDPYSGALIEGNGAKGEGFFQGTRSLHRWLTAGDFGNRDVGKQIVDASTVLLVVLAFSGLYLRWPRSAGNWRSWLKLDFALQGRSFLWHLHAVIGTWMLALYVVMALTGLFFGYDWYRDGLYSLTGTPRPAPRGEMSRAGTSGREQVRPVDRGRDVMNGRDESARSDVSGDAMSGRGQSARGDTSGSAMSARGQTERRAGATPDLTATWAAFLRASASDGYSIANLDLSHGKRVEIRYLAAKAPHVRAFNTFEVDAVSGAVLKNERYAAKPAGAKLIASMFPLHTGSFFGLPGLVIYMIASLGMPLFAITGWMLYLDRRKKKYAARATARELVATRSKTLANTHDLLIGFASQAGFARQLAWQTADSLQSAGVNVQVHSLAKLSSEQLSTFKRALFVVSTFGEGEPPDEARGFERKIMKGSMPLTNMKFGLLALGDRQYRTFCAFGQTLDGWLRRQGAQPMFPRVDVDCGRPEALYQWQERLGELTGTAGSAWIEPQFARWRLVNRQLLNAGSVGAPMYLIELQPADSKSLSWQAGDIAEILAPPVPTDRDVETTEAASIAAVGEPTKAGFLLATRDSRTATAADGRREYSIASIPEDSRLQLVIRQVQRRDSTLGLGSGWLTKHAPLDTFVKLRVRANPTFHAPDRDSPLILIGNGTGIAGLRSHLKARAHRKGKGVWLIYGERNEQYDYLFRREIEAWLATGTLERLDLAFSRDQPEQRRSGPHSAEPLCAQHQVERLNVQHRTERLNVQLQAERLYVQLQPERLNVQHQAERLYVQNIVTARAETVKEWIRRGAAILVCGSLEGMAPGVQSALHQVLGEPELAHLAAEGRYRRDVY